jgi:hypothetical protein
MITDLAGSRGHVLRQQSLSQWTDSPSGPSELLWMPGNEVRRMVRLRASKRDEDKRIVHSPVLSFEVTPNR